jgi:hypothetical protein
LGVSERGPFSYTKLSYLCSMKETISCDYKLLEGIINFFFGDNGWYGKVEPNRINVLINGMDVSVESDAFPADIISLNSMVTIEIGGGGIGRKLDPRDKIKQRSPGIANALSTLFISTIVKDNYYHQTIYQHGKAILVKEYPEKCNTEKVVFSYTLDTKSDFTYDPDICREIVKDIAKKHPETEFVLDLMEWFNTKEK